MTKYSLDVLDAETREWTSVALFSDIVPADVLADMGRTLWDDVDGADDVAVIDIDTGEVVWCHTDDTQQDEPAWIDDNPSDIEWDDHYYDMGFDPYMGCYTDDC